MNKELITTDSILAYLEKAASEKLSLAPEQYISAAMSLTALLGNEMDTLYTMESKLAGMRVVYIQNGMKVNAARAFIEADSLYLEMKRQKGKIDRIIETVRLAKLRARMAQEDFKAQ